VLSEVRAAEVRMRGRGGGLQVLGLKELSRADPGSRESRRRAEAATTRPARQNFAVSRIAARTSAELGRISSSRSGQ
jgi:hypothetical protein